MQPVAIMSRPEVPPAPHIYSARGRIPARKPTGMPCGSQTARHCSSPAHIDRRRLPVLSSPGSPNSEEDRSHSPVRQAWDRFHVDAARCARRKTATAHPAPLAEAAQLALASASRRGTVSPCSVFSKNIEELEDQFLQLYENDHNRATPLPKWHNCFSPVERATILAEQGERRNRLKVLISNGRIAAATHEVICHAETHEARSKKAHGIDQKVRSNVRAMGEQRLELSSARKDLEGILKKHHGPKGVNSSIRHLLQNPQTQRKDPDSSVISSPTRTGATQAQIRARAAQQPPTYAAGVSTRHIGSVRWSVDFDH